MTDTRCQAAAMDAAAMFGDPDLFNDGDTIPACEDLGEINVCGFKLCAGCAEALATLVSLGAVMKKRLGS
jgi:hypothetical protein